MKKIILLIFLFLFLYGCINTNSIGKQQIKLRKCINKCETFDCSELPKQIKILKNMIKNNNKYQGVQQSIVTTITKKCKYNILNKPCKCYSIEQKKLNSILK